MEAKIAQLGERMTEDHKVRCSIHLLGAFLTNIFLAKTTQESKVKCWQLFLIGNNKGYKELTLIVW